VASHRRTHDPCLGRHASGRDSPAFPAAAPVPFRNPPDATKKPRTQSRQVAVRQDLHSTAPACRKTGRLAMCRTGRSVRADSFLLRQRKETQTGADSAELSALTPKHKVSLTSGRSPFRVWAVKRKEGKSILSQRFTARSPALRTTRSENNQRQRQTMRRQTPRFRQRFALHFVACRKL